MNGEGGPESKLRLRQLQGHSDGRKNQQWNRINNEDWAQRYSQPFVAGPGNGPNGGDGAAATNRCSRRNEKCRHSLHAQKPTQGHSDEQGEADTEHGIDEAAASSVNDLVKVHSEAESYY